MVNSHYPCGGTRLESQAKAGAMSSVKSVYEEDTEVREPLVLVMSTNEEASPEVYVNAEATDCLLSLRQLAESVTDTLELLC